VDAQAVSATRNLCKSSAGRTKIMANSLFTRRLEEMTDGCRKEIEGRAINTYGEQPQVDMCIEEMSELTKAILKYRRAENKNKNEAEYLEDDIIEEIADVQIMLDQMRIIFGDTYSQEEYKLNRLWARMEAET
jgi:hypothetical protein